MYAEIGGNRPGDEGGGVFELEATRLWGNCSGLGRECVLSNKPHLLQSY